MPRLDIGRYFEEPEYQNGIDTAIANAIVVGFCVFNGSIDVSKKLLADLQLKSVEATGNHLLFSCDCEWGLSMRLSGPSTEFPHALALARSSYPDAVYKTAFTIGSEMRAVGLHWNFAPVADVNSNPDNPIINIRSFGEDPEMVSKAAIAYFEGLRDAGSIATAKHFPGHGDTRVDSHTALPVLDKSPGHFSEVELRPFQSLIRAGIPSVMTGHLAAPHLARSLGATLESDRPATVSRFLTQKLIREQLGFTGVVITDSLEMAAVKSLFPTEAELCKAAIRAGNDILLMPTDFQDVHRSLLQECKIDSRFYDIVLQANQRIERLSTYVTSGISKGKITEDLGKNVAFNIAISAIEYSGDLDVITRMTNYRIVSDDEQLQLTRKKLLIQLLNDKFPELKAATDQTKINTITFILQRPRGRLLDEHFQKPSQTPVEQYIAAGETTDCIFLLGNPYLENALTDAKCVVKTYSDSTPSIQAAIQWLIKNK